MQIRAAISLTFYIYEVEQTESKFEGCQVVKNCQTLKTLSEN